ncbi:Tryptophan aminotransferase-related protein 3 [Bienertia sinuspersici]
MMNYVMYNTMGVSHDAQLRVFKLLQTIVAGGGREIFEHAHEILHKRWKLLYAILSTSARFSVQHIPPQFCTFYQRVRGPSPGNFLLLFQLPFH